MSYTNHCVFYGYGIEAPDLPLREEFEELANNDKYEVKDYIENGLVDELPDKSGIFAKRNAPEMVYGPGTIMYIGFESIIPYETPIMTKEQMDKMLYDAQVYLYGEEQKDKFAEPKVISEVWDE